MPCGYHSHRPAGAWQMSGERCGNWLALRALLPGRLSRPPSGEPTREDGASFKIGGAGLAFPHLSQPVSYLQDLTPSGHRYTFSRSELRRFYQHQRLLTFNRWPSLPSKSGTIILVRSPFSYGSCRRQLKFLPSR